MRDEEKDETWECRQDHREARRGLGLQTSPSPSGSLSFPLIHFGPRQQRVRQLWLRSDKHNQRTNIFSAIKPIPVIELFLVGLLKLGEKNSAANDTLI